MSDCDSIVRRVAAACLCAAALLAQAQTTAPPPTPAFFKPDKMQNAQLSPSGRWLAAMTSVPDRRIGFMIIDLEGKEGSRFIEASPKDDVDWFTWVSDDWITFSVWDPMDPARVRVRQRPDGAAPRRLELAHADHARLAGDRRLPQAP